MVFPATRELVNFVGLAAVMAVTLYFVRKRLSSLKLKIYGYLRDAHRFPSFPRAWVAADVRPLPPMRHVTPRHVVLRLKFTVAMLFLNVYTYAFTQDLNGEISNDILHQMGFSYQNFMQHKWFVLITSNFLHFHLLHLSANMLMLLIFGGSLELLVGTRIATTVYLIAMNSNIPNGLALLPALRIFFPKLWSETVQFVDVGASLGIIGSLGGLARLLKPSARWSLLSVTAVVSVGAAILSHQLIGVDHAFSAVLGYLTAHICLNRSRLASKPLPAIAPPPQLDFKKPMAA